MEVFWMLLMTTVIMAVPYFRNNFFGWAYSSREGHLEKGRQFQREEFFDFLKGVAMVAVVIIHVVYFYLESDVEQNKLFLWWANNLSRFAIPVFFICSGIVLDSHERKGYWKKKIVRLLVPYLLVAVSIAIFRRYSIAQSFKEIATGEIILPFYFIIVLFQFYLIHPLLVKIRKQKWFLPVTLLISIGSFVYWSSQNIFGFPTFFQYLFFFAYGIRAREFFLNANFEERKKTRWLWVFVVAMQLIFLTAWPKHYYNNQYFYGLAVFNLLFLLKENKSRIIKYFSIVGKNSLWIFLLHFTIIGVVFSEVIKYRGSFQLGFWVIIVCSLLLSFAAAFLMGKMYSRFSQAFFDRSSQN